MTVSFASDSETDRLMSMRASSMIPLPPEISLSDPKNSWRFFRKITFYKAYGLTDHPVVRLMLNENISTMMSVALSRADHLDRVSHYGAWLGKESVTIEDLTQPACTAAGGGLQGPPRGGSPTRGDGAAGDPWHKGEPDPIPIKSPDGR